MESSKLTLEMSPMFGGQWGSIMFGAKWKVPTLVAFGMFHVWLPLEGEGETSFSPPSTFHPIRFYFNFFPLILRFYFTMVLNHYYMFFLHFPLPINYNHAFQGTNSSTHSSPN
jgi:hypothetical protein